MPEPTEEASPQRIQKAREEGRVALSRDAVGAASLLAGLGAFSASREGLLRAFRSSLTLSLEAARGAPAPSPTQALGAALTEALTALVAPLAAAAAAAVFVGALLSGFLFAPGAAMPKLERLDPLGALARYGKPRTWVEPLVQLGKGALLLYLGYTALHALVPVWLALPRGTSASLRSVLEVSLRAPLTRMGALLALAAGLDVLYRRWQHAQDLRMTKEDLKREHKESEGDPHLKHERERLHHEMLQEATLERVRKANFVVTNPTHYAVALGWDAELMEAPELFAKGEGSFAQKIIAEAHRSGVPVLRDAPLARSLHECEVGEPIPPELFEAVAAVVNYLTHGGEPERYEPSED